METLEEFEERVDLEAVNEKAKLTSVDKPYLKHMPHIEYDFDLARVKPIDFLEKASLSFSPSYRKNISFNFYGKKITKGNFFDMVNKAGNAFLNMGTKKDEVIPMFCLNIPETYYSMYGLNDFGMITEWFNPLVMTTDGLRKYLNENKIKTLVMIDAIYPIFKNAIADSNVEKIIVTSVQDSFPLRKKLLYKAQVFGFNAIIENPYYRHAIETIDGKIPSERALTNLSTEEQNKLLKHYQTILLKLNSYIKKEKIMAKASFYRDNDKDDRFILWKDFIDEYSELDSSRRVPYEENRTTFIVHTGGTTGPAKPIAHTDFALNAAVYQTAKTPVGIEKGETLCQIIPPMVAYPLETIHFGQYMQMPTHLIATYDREEFVDIIEKTKANHYNVVPSFAKAITEKGLTSKDFGFVKSMQYGGEGISKDADQEIDNLLGGCGHHGFGQNEEFGVFTGNYDLPGVKKEYGSCGFPMLGNEYIIINPDSGLEMPYGLDNFGNPYIGDIYVTGPTIMKGYIREANVENKNTIFYREGIKYIKTGDQGYVDEEGRLWYWTRNQRIIRTQEGKIFANIIEDILNEIPEISECCVVKSPHPVNVSEASCHIVLKPECWNEDIDKIINHIISIVETKTKAMYSYYVPGTYEFRSKPLPHTAFGKIEYTTLEKENEEAYSLNNGLALKKIRIK